MTLTWARTSSARLIGSVEFQFGPGPANATRYVTVGERVPTLGLSSYKAVVLVEGWNAGGRAELTTQMKCRVCATDRELPGAWLDFEDDPVVLTAAGSRNTGSMSVVTAYATAMWGEVAIALSGSTATMTVTVKVLLYADES